MYNYTAGKSLKHPFHCPYVLPGQQLNYVGERLRHCLHPAWKRWFSPQSELQYLQPSSSRSIVEENLTFVSTC